MRKNLLINLTLIAVITGLSASFSFSQSNREIPVQNKKANKRPADDAPNQPKKPEFSNEKIDESIESDDDILTIETSLVTIPVRVLDRQGRFLGGLKKEDFTVFEDKAEQNIEYFSNENSPFTVALVLDMSYSTVFKINEIQQAALSFISQLRPEDKVMIVSFDGEINVLSEPTSDRKQLEQAVIRTQIGSGTSLYEAVDFVVSKRLSSVTGRKAIVLFTDGVDTTSRRVHDRDNLNALLEFDALVYPIKYDTYADVKAMEQGRVVITDPGAQTTPPIGGGRIPTGTANPLPFPIPTGTIGTGTPTRSLPGSGTSPEEYRKAAEYLNEMALRTGGRLYEANDVGRLTYAFSQIASELREFYSIGYYPNMDDKSKKRRSIKVKVAREKVAVKSRDSYVIGEKKK
ncbi:MAG: VWA domain-containing protein [Pyrinomonadaceae bacterium]